MSDALAELFQQLDDLIKAEDSDAAIQVREAALRYSRCSAPISREGTNTSRTSPPLSFRYAIKFWQPHRATVTHCMRSW